jgi:hypothetical protein
MNIAVSVSEVLLKPAITDLRKSHLQEKVAPVYPVRNNKIILAEARRRKGNIIMFVFFFPPLRLCEKNYFYLFGRLWPSSLVKIKILEVSFKAT